MTCPDCERNAFRAALWRHEAYKLGGTPLPWDADEVLAKAVTAEREACAKLVFQTQESDDEYVSLRETIALAIRARGEK